jgi:hypothetical protein
MWMLRGLDKTRRMGHAAYNKSIALAAAFPCIDTKELCVEKEQVVD